MRINSLVEADMAIAHPIKDIVKKQIINLFFKKHGVIKILYSYQITRFSICEESFKL